tara:strand:- start:13164 stop:14162 length:999 start_codon:yes stop_codon:yes gene_type:complete
MDILLGNGLISFNPSKLLYGVMFENKAFIIVNPEAGDGLAAKRWKKFQFQLIEKNIPFEFCFTEYRDHATEIVKGAVQKGFTRIGTFGGDGTVNEVLQGIFENDEAISPELKLIYFPAGSSCDFEKIFSEKKDPLEKIRSDNSTAIDVFKVECRGFDGMPISRYIINNSSIGVISLANEKFNSVSGISKSIKQWSVDAGAIICGIKALIETEDFECEVQLDDNKINGLTLSNLTVFKTPYFGGGMNYGIETLQDDGLVTVAFINSTSKLKLLSMIPSLYTGKIFKRKAAWNRQCKTIEIKTDKKVIVETDGENIGVTPAKYTILEKALNVVV